MTELSNWKNIIVPQRHSTGCIPTGYEWLIRYLGVQGVNLETFQEDFDLDLHWDRKTSPKNNFDSVAGRIKARYPHINIQIRSFDQGLEKIKVIRSLIENQSPCLISLALGGILGWHIMPIVYVNNQRIEMIHEASERGNHTWDFSIEEVIRRHNDFPGGKDIAWIEV